MLVSKNRNYDFINKFAADFDILTVPQWRGHGWVWVGKAPMRFSQIRRLFEGGRGGVGGSG